MTRRSLVWWGLAALAAAVVLGAAESGVLGLDASALDVWWNTAMAQLRSPFLVSFAHVMNQVGGGWIATFVVPLAIAAALVIARRWRAAVFALTAFVLSAGLVQVLKQIFGRARPEEMLVLSDYGSFPSGHTANAATIAVFVCVLFPRVWTVLLGVLWVLAMALSRTLLSVHWLTDTIGGALVGAAAVLLLAAVLLPWVGGPRVPHIRPYRAEDREAISEVCLRTANAGKDATGLLSDDELWGLIFALPYVQRHPDLAWIVESDDGRVVGYIIGTDDTDAFEQWFRDEWWPQFADRFPRPEHERTREDGIVEYAYRRAPGREPNAAEYPSHLHIDLLPETQGQGLGRRLLETLFAELTHRGVPGLHLGMDPANTAAAAFYERVGLERLPAVPEALVYGIRFSGRPGHAVND